MNVAVFGSRDGVDQDVVVSYLEPRFHTEVVLVSGGARGADSFAETYWRGRGGRVLSIRPVQIDQDDYAIEYWLDDNVWRPQEWPTFGDFKSAAFMRNWIIADQSDRGVAFWHNKSRGTADTITRFADYGKECAIHEV
jgi:hypothetical protein